MARFDTAFDATGIEPTTAYEILPAGKYRAQIVENGQRQQKNLERNRHPAAQQGQNTKGKGCSPSAPMRQECGIEQRSVLVSS